MSTSTEHSSLPMQLKGPYKIAEKVTRTSFSISSRRGSIEYVLNIAFPYPGDSNSSIYLYLQKKEYEENVVHESGLGENWALNPPITPTMLETLQQEFISRGLDEWTSAKMYHQTVSLLSNLASLNQSVFAPEVGRMYFPSEYIG